MKKLKILFVTAMLILASCEKESLDQQNPNQIYDTQIYDTQITGEDITRKAGNLLHLVQGPDFRRFNFDVNGDRHSDVLAIKTRNTGTRTTEIHVLDGKSGFKKFLLQTGTALHQTGSNWDFIPAYTDRDNRLGLHIYAIKKNRTGTRSTEVHLISQNFHSFKRFVHQGGTLLPETNNSYTFKITQRRPFDNDLHTIEVFRNGRPYLTLDGRNRYQ